VDSYDIATKSWSRVGKMPEPVSATAVVKHENILYLIGSYNDINFLGSYDPKEVKFDLVKSNMIGRRHAGVGVIQNQLFIFGGNQGMYSPWLNSTQVADLPK